MSKVINNKIGEELSEILAAWRATAPIDTTEASCGVSQWIYDKACEYLDKPLHSVFSAGGGNSTGGIECKSTKTA